MGPLSVGGTMCESDVMWWEFDQACRLLVIFLVAERKFLSQLALHAGGIVAKPRRWSHICGGETLMQ